MGAFADVTNSGSSPSVSATGLSADVQVPPSAPGSSPSVDAALLLSMKMGNDHLKSAEERNLRAQKEARQAQKKEDARKRAKRSYEKLQYEKQFPKLNNGNSMLKPKKIQFIDGQPVPGQCLATSQIKWRDANQMTCSGNVVCPYTRGKEILENHVIAVLPNGSYKAIEEGRIRLDPQPQVTYRSYHMKAGTLVKQHTRGCSGRGNNKQYCLIRYENNQYQWVPEEEIIQTEEGRRRNIRKPKFYQNQSQNGDLHYKPQNDDNAAREGEHVPFVIPAHQYPRFKKIWSTAKSLVGIEPSISSAVTEALFEHPVREGTGEEGTPNIKIMTETSLLYERLREKIEGKYPPLEDVIGGELEYVAGMSNLVRNGHVLGREGSNVMVRQLLQLSSADAKEEEGKTPTRDEGGEGDSLAQSKKNKSDEDLAPQHDWKQKQPQKVIKNMCHHPGCSTPAHSSTLPHCKRHSKRPKLLCVNCQKCQAKRKGKLCEACFQKLHPNESLCRHCSLMGYARKPRMFGGLCNKCIKDGVKDERKCVDCHKRPRTRRGGRCYFCDKSLQK